MTDADILAVFSEFPVPLVLFDANGHGARGNARYLAQYHPESLSGRQLGKLFGAAHESRQDLSLASRAGPVESVRARVVRTEHHVLLVLEEGDGSDCAAELEDLRARIGELERAASTDHLTGAWNRAHLDRVIGAELMRSVSSRMPVSLVLLDIDHFKEVNDTYGHAVGDMVLRELVAVVRTKVRASDLVFRWGGEEFVVLVSAAGYRRAEKVAEKLRVAVAAHPFPKAGKVTISLGVAEHVGDEDASAWFRRVDAVLYEAKESGRNRTVVDRRGNSDAWAAGGNGVLQLAWHEAFESGDPTIDDEHKEMFRLANVLIEASLREQAAPGTVRAPLAALLAHVQKHFADEEAILAQRNYEGLPEHRRAHAGLVQRALTLASRLETGEAGVGAVVEFLAQDVVARHLKLVDRAYFPLFSGAGMQASTA